MRSNDELWNKYKFLHPFLMLDETEKLYSLHSNKTSRIGTTVLELTFNLFTFSFQDKIN